MSENASHRRYVAAAAAAAATVTGVRRRGKFLLVDLDAGDQPGSVLVIHLGMTGQLLVDAPVDHAQARFVFTSGDVHLRDPRGFGRSTVVAADTVLVTVPALGRMGPEPDDDTFDAARVAKYLGPPGSTLKARLLEQRLVAGVGNYLADELLHRVGVAPTSTRLGAYNPQIVVDAYRKLVNESIAAGGFSVRDYVHLDGTRGRFAEQLQVHSRHGQRCRACTTPLSSGRVAGRGTVWCPTCQPHVS
jgi:formamidopyrimidine-DNA glycosylase